VSSQRCADADPSPALPATITSPQVSRAAAAVPERCLPAFLHLPTPSRPHPTTSPDLAWPPPRLPRRRRHSWAQSCFKSTQARAATPACLAAAALDHLIVPPPAIRPHIPLPPLLVSDTASPPLQVAERSDHPEIAVLVAAASPPRGTAPSPRGMTASSLRGITAPSPRGATAPSLLGTSAPPPALAPGAALALPSGSSSKQIRNKKKHKTPKARPTAQSAATAAAPSAAVATPAEAYRGRSYPAFEPAQAHTMRGQSQTASEPVAVPSVTSAHLTRGTHCAAAGLQRPPPGSSSLNPQAAVFVPAIFTPALFTPDVFTPTTSTASGALPAQLRTTFRRAVLTSPPQQSRPRRSQPSQLQQHSSHQPSPHQPASPQGNFNPDSRHHTSPSHQRALRRGTGGGGRLLAPTRGRGSGTATSGTTTSESRRRHELVVAS
jgi:hypothetical protein